MARVTGSKSNPALKRDSATAWPRPLAPRRHSMIRRLIPIGVLAAALAGCNPFYSVEQSMVERGYRWVHRGEMDKAIATFEMATQKYPQSVSAHLGLADALFEARKDREAVDSYTSAMSLLEKTKPKSDGGAPGETEVIGEQFFSYQNQGLKFPHGLEAYLYLRRGGAFEGLATRDSPLNREYLSKALADYDKAIELAPKYDEAQKQRNRLIERSNGTESYSTPNLSVEKDAAKARRPSP